MEAASEPAVALSKMEDDPELARRLEEHVKMLASTIGERNLDRPEAYRSAAQYLTQQLEEMGYEVKAQLYTVEGQECANLITERAGSKPILVVGAHYDTIDFTPGADDNASGCAALLELARMLAKDEDGPTVRLVLFANEEPPYFHGQSMGSLVYAASCAEAGDKLVGMVSLESMGYFTEQPNSQQYPLGLAGTHTVGNFLAFVSDLSSQDFMRQCEKVFLQSGALEVDGIAAPAVISGIGWSDQWSFWQHGYKGFMVTDTAPYRNPNYHLSTDTPDTLDYRRLARAVHGLHAVVQSFN